MSNCDRFTNLRGGLPVYGTPCLGSDRDTSSQGIPELGQLTHCTELLRFQVLVVGRAMEWDYHAWSSDPGGFTVPEVAEYS